jgi:hypothetical protein
VAGVFLLSAPLEAAEADPSEADRGTRATLSESSRPLLDNNLKCVDLSDLTEPLPLDVVHSRQILRQTEPWERSTWEPAGDRDSVGYPTVVRNDRGPSPDGRYYLYYAHHDPTSGIGCAVADSVDGPYRKLAQLESGRRDSQVLVCPGSRKPGDPSHYSSPCVVWNEQERLWFMYFHYYNHYYSKTLERGLGHQLTALATTPDLASHRWKPVEDAALPTHPKLVPVLPTTKKTWINSQSSYHAVGRLPDGRWLAFLRGTGGEEGTWANPCKLGFAASKDGRRWDYFAENPVIHQDDGNDGRRGVYRPHFFGCLGGGEYLLVWSESLPFDADPKIMYGRTRDVRNVTRDPRGYARWPAGDGLISPWRQGDRLYLFAGKHVHVMHLPVSLTTQPR